MSDTETVSSEYLLVKNKDIIYQVGHTEDLIGAGGIDNLVVIKHGKGQLADILLDSDTVVNAIRNNFVK